MIYKYNNKKNEGVMLGKLLHKIFDLNYADPISHSKQLCSSRLILARITGALILAGKITLSTQEEGFPPS